MTRAHWKHLLIPSKWRKSPMIASLAVALTGAAVQARWRPVKLGRPSVPADDDFRVVTWNVGYFSPVPVKSAQSSDTGPIIDVLRKTFSHVVILQELGSARQADQIAHSLGDDWMAYTVPSGIRGQFLSALTCLPTESIKVKQAGGKKMLGMSVRFKSQSMFVLALHAPHPVRGPLRTRRYIRLATEWARGRTEDFVLLAGDLNYHFALPGKPRGMTNKLYDEIQSDFADSTASIGPTFYARTRIDHVFHSPKNLSVVLDGTGVMALPLRFGSRPGWRDHRPIVVTINQAG
jgi:endonuclease/exonuclease/phosphatase family metal-dependent hydrolase